ncbi:T9SS type A sorting domain-containing protein [Wenyingzhuangia sp. IMCC45574]
MLKKLHFTFILLSSFILNAQLNVDYETVNYALGSNGGVITNEAIANDTKTADNMSDNCGKITETTGAFNWDFATWSDPKFGLNPANGLYVSCKVLSKNETTFTMKFITRHWDAGSGANVFNEVEQTVNVGAIDTWHTVEFDLSSETYIDNWCNQFAFQFNSANGLRDGDVYYIDDIVQSTNATLSTKTNELHKDTYVHPNPAERTINISSLHGAKTITISSILGRTIKTLPATTTVNIQDLTSGVYILSTDNGFQGKIIKK